MHVVASRTSLESDVSFSPRLFEHPAAQPDVSRALGRTLGSRCIDRTSHFLLALRTLLSASFEYRNVDANEWSSTREQWQRTHDEWAARVNAVADACAARGREIEQLLHEHQRIVTGFRARKDAEWALHSSYRVSPYTSDPDGPAKAAAAAAAAAEARHRIKAIFDRLTTLYSEAIFATRGLDPRGGWPTDVLHPGSSMPKYDELQAREASAWSQLVDAWRQFAKPEGGEHPPLFRGNRLPDWEIPDRPCPPFVTPTSPGWRALWASLSSRLLHTIDRADRRASVLTWSLPTPSPSSLPTSSNPGTFTLESFEQDEAATSACVSRSDRTSLTWVPQGNNPYEKRGYNLPHGEVRFVFPARGEQASGTLFGIDEARRLVNQVSAFFDSIPECIHPCGVLYELALAAWRAEFARVRWLVVSFAWEPGTHAMKLSGSGADTEADAQALATGLRMRLEQALILPTPPPAGVPPLVSWPEKQVRTRTWAAIPTWED